MLKKEFKEIIMPTLTRFSFILIILLTAFILGGFKLPRRGSAFIMMFSSVIIFWIANNLGISAFKFEIQDNALE